VKIAYINIFVSDLNKAVNFYQQTLGLSLLTHDPDFGYAAFQVGAIKLGLAVPGAEQLQLIGGHSGIGLAVTDLDNSYQKLIDAGARFSMEPTRQPWGGYMALLEDPDGNRFYLDQVSEIID